jgi:O-antigen/teichoic acid export membrane protein
VLVSSDDLTGIAEKAARGGLFLFVGNTSATVVLAIGSIIIARLLGPSGYGLYALALLMPSLLVPLADAGMNYALVRLPARRRSEGDYYGASRVIRLAFLVKLFTSAVAFLICYFGAEMIAATVLNRPELASLLQLASVLIVFQAVLDATSSSFIGLDLMQYSASIQILYSILKSVVAPALILIGFGLAGAISGYVLGVAVAGVTGATILFTKHARSTGEMSDSVSVELGVVFRYCLPLYLAAILSVLFSQYQNIVLAFFATNVEIGNFSAAWNFNMLLTILVYPITTAMFPMFSKMDPSQRTELARAFALAVKYASLLMIPASVAVMIFSEDLAYLTYGKSYTLAPQYLIILSALYLLTGLGYLILGSFLSGVADTKTVLGMSILTLASYLPLGLALTWLWGPRGLLFAYILSNAISTVYGIRQASGKFGARPDLKASGRVLLAAAGAAVPTVGLIHLDGLGIGAVNLTIGGLLFLVVYLTLAPILGAVDKQDIPNLRTVLGGTRIVSTVANPVLDYESKLLSAMGRN